jgi:hypothetical protein
LTSLPFSIRSQRRRRAAIKEALSPVFLLLFQKGHSAFSLTAGTMQKIFLCRQRVSYLQAMHPPTPGKEFIAQPPFHSD